MASDSSICSGNTVNFFDQSAGEATSWEWYFEGGQPEISTEKNPTGIYYDLPGSYEVKLKVSNYFGLDSITNSNFIAVSEAPAQPEIPVGPDSLYMNPEDTEFYTNSVPGAESYLWSLVPENAGQILVVDTTCLVDWSETFIGDAELSVLGINECGEGIPSEKKIVTMYVNVTMDEIDGIELNVYPNPTKGLINIDLPKLSKEPHSLRLMDMRGVLVHEAEIPLGEKNHQIDLSSLEAGIYILIASNNNTSRLIKVVLLSD